MARKIITLVGPQEIIDQLATVELTEVEVGASRPSDALTDAADGPLGPEEIKQLLQLITVAFSTGTSALVFLKHLRELLNSPKAPRPASVKVKDGRTGRILAAIDESTDVESLAKQLFQ